MLTMFLCGKNQSGEICHIVRIGHIVFKLEDEKNNLSVNLKTI